MKERHFRIGVHLLRGLADAEEAAAAYSAVADAVLAGALAGRHRRLRHPPRPAARAPAPSSSPWASSAAAR